MLFKLCLVFVHNVESLPLFVEKLYTTTSIDVQRKNLGSPMYIKTFFLNQCHTTKLTYSEKWKNYDCKL